MKNLKTKTICSKGFTLVEVIVTIMAAGILGAIFIQFMGTALNSGWNAVEIVRDEAGGEGIMEKIIADYVREINSDPSTALGTLVTNNNDASKPYGENVTMQYIYFDETGNEVVTASSDNLKVMLKSSGPVSPAITGRFALTMILTKSRKDTNDPPVLY